MGGIETYSERLCALLARYGKVECRALPGRADGSAPGFVSILGYGLRAGLSIMVRPRPADVVHVADMASWPLAACALLRSRRTRVVLSAHGTDVAYPEQSGILPWLYGAYLGLGARLLRSVPVIANSRATCRKVEALGFLCDRVVPLASDLVPAWPLRQKPRRSVLFAGRLVERKGCRWFVENVLPLLPQDVTLDVAGTLWDKSEAAALDDPRVRHIGRLDADGLARHFADNACVIVPNIASGDKSFEGFGLVAAEAAVAGGVVLASSHSGLVDAVIDGRTGFLLEPEDASAWAAKINEVLGWSDEQRASFIKQSTALAQRHFRWDRVAEDTFAAYDWRSAE
jgi:glycosyltransferase involved in cell wall biosynthesis